MINICENGLKTWIPLVSLVKKKNEMFCFPRIMQPYLSDKIHNDMNN